MVYGDEGSVLEDFFDSSSCSVSQVKCNGHPKILESVLTEALSWIEGKYLVKICFSESLEENTRSCVNEGLIKLMNLTILRYFVAHRGRKGRENVKADKFLMGVLTAYSSVLAMFVEEQSCHRLKAEPLKAEEMRSIDQFIVTLIESTSPVHLRQVDQDLLLGCGPSVADCGIRVLSS